MAGRRALVPYHFGQRWDIIPNRIGRWELVTEKILARRLAAVARLEPELVVSGDCMSAIAAHKNGLPLVWFDAHGDFHTLTTTETGNLGGMPLAMLFGYGSVEYLDVCGKLPVRTPVYHVGGSEFDEGERQRMTQFGVKVLDKLLPSDLPVGPLHLHIDTDVIRSTDLPSSIHPAPAGMPLILFWEQLDLLLPRTAVLSVKSYDPRLDAAGRGEEIVLELIRRFEHERACKR